MITVCATYLSSSNNDAFAAKSGTKDLTLCPMTLCPGSSIRISNKVKYG